MRARIKQLDEPIFIPIELTLRFYSENELLTFRSILKEAKRKYDDATGVLKYAQIEMIDDIQDAIKSGLDE